MNVSVVGNNSIGKTQLIQSLSTNPFRRGNSYAIGLMLYQNLIFDKRVNFWEFDELFNPLNEFIIRKSSIIFLVYDTTCHKSFAAAITRWLNIARENCSTDAVIVLVGCKSDLQEFRKVPREEVEAASKWAESNYFELSAGDSKQESQKHLRNILYTSALKLTSGPLLSNELNQDTRFVSEEVSVKRVWLYQDNKQSSNPAENINLHQGFEYNTKFVRGAKASMYAAGHHIHRKETIGNIYNQRPLLLKKTKSCKHRAAKKHEQSSKKHVPEWSRNHVTSMHNVKITPAPVRVWR